MVDVLIAVGLFAFLVASLEVGFWAGQRASSEDYGVSSGQIGAIQGAILGLLGLLLAFSFAAAATRFIERQDLIVQEANAIGTAYLRADLLDEPHRSELRATLKQYTEQRIAVSGQLRHGLRPDDAAEAEQMQSRMWRAGIAGVKARPEFAVTVLSPINDVIDLHSTRVAAGRKRLPALVVGLLLTCSALSIGTIGYGTAMSGRRRVMLNLSLVAIVGASLWITLDLDNPRAGLMQLSDEPLKSITFDQGPG